MGDIKKDLLERFFSVKEGLIFFSVSSILLYPLMKGINTDAIPEIHLAHAIWYAGILFAIWFLFLLHIGLHISKNMWLVKKYIIASIASSVAFMAYFFSDMYKPPVQNTEYIGILALNFIFFLLAIYMYQKYIPEKVKEVHLFQEQQADIDRIIAYLKGNCNILGIEAVFGNGKTFLLQELKRKLENGKKSYEFLEIDVIACNLDSLADVLVKEIDTILYKNQIISKFSNRLRKFFSQKQEVSFLGELIFGKQETYSNIFKGFKDELERTGKTIVLLYEDLDRIRDENLIRKIFIYQKSSAAIK